METRVYAEDPYRNFLPSIGRLVTYRPPRETSDHGITVRNDTGVSEGGEISLYYDPMIAKLVTHAWSREEAIAAQSRALDTFAIDGIRHNIPFLSALMQHPRWLKGRLSTAFIAEEYPGGFHPIAAEGERAETIATIACAIDFVIGERRRRISGQIVGKPVERERQRAVWLDRLEIRMSVAREKGDIFVRLVGAGGAEGKPRVVTSSWHPGEPVWTGTIDGDPVSAHVRPIANGFRLAHHGVEVKAYVYTEHEARAARLMPEKSLGDSGKKVLCPMPGLVRAIAGTVGQEGKAGETIAIVEAMKMEIVLRAERDGTVAKIHAKEGDSLAVDAVILEFA